MGGRGLGGVCDHSNHFGYHIKEIGLWKAWGAAMLKGPGESTGVSQWSNSDDIGQQVKFVYVTMCACTFDCNIRGHTTNSYIFYGYSGRLTYTCTFVETSCNYMKVRQVIIKLM